MASWQEATTRAHLGGGIYDASLLSHDCELEGDVVIIGSGAGGGVAAELCAEHGLKVLLIEEGPYRHAEHFNMRESRAYQDLYQESGARKTKDRSISIYQGRCVGGSTTVNWTTSFRTPEATLKHWQEVHGLAEVTSDAMAPWFSRMEKRLSMHSWQVEPNGNNAILARGARALGYQVGVISRNVHNCANLGYCGMGCPTNAKQSMLVTTIPAALKRSTQVWSRLRAHHLEQRGGQVKALHCQVMAGDGVHRLPYQVKVRARYFILAAGSIGSPALLLRSQGFNPYGQVGRRTFLHPVCISAAVMPELVNAYRGAPQVIYSDEFLWPAHGEEVGIGFKLETPPVHPLLAATVLSGFGTSHRRLMAHFPHMGVLIALLRDGFAAGSPGGNVELGSHGQGVLDYPLTPYLWEGFRRAYLAMAEIQFAAGARFVVPVHEQGAPYRSFAAAKKAIEGLTLKPLLAKLASAHVMGGCAMGNDPRRAVVDAAGRFHGKENLLVCDGSVFPTSVGANPQLSIYGLAARNVSKFLTAIK